MNIVSDNWLAINEFRSVLRRLSQYEEAIDRNGVIARRVPVVQLVDAADADVEKQSLKHARDAEAPWEDT